MRMLSVHLLDAPVVAIAVETNGADPGNAELVALSAAKFHGDRLLDGFVSDASLDPIALGAFIGDAPIVAHDLAATVGFVAGLGTSLGAELWDTQELAELLMPRSADDDIYQLASRLGVSCADHHEGTARLPASMAAAETVHAVYRDLVARVEALPASVVRRLADLLMRARSPLASLMEALSESPARRDSWAIGGIDQKEIASRLERPRGLGQLKAQQLVDPEEVSNLLSGDGPFALRFPKYEPRLEQIAMSRAAAEAFGSRADAGHPHHLVVEGGTGIGKSVAYLLPAVLFAVRNNARVVVSTNTINLQEQLVTKDIPDLLAVLNDVPDLDLSKFKYTQMKGKANYLCLRRWEGMANSEGGTTDDARTMAKTLAWLLETQTGDRSELHLTMRELSSWERLNASGFAACSGAREGACFYRHAREEAAAAHLLVVNHSLLLSNMAVGGSLLPDYDYLVVDEAHNLEAEATRQFGFRVSRSSVEELLERLGNIVDGLRNVVRISKLQSDKAEAIQRDSNDMHEPIAHVREMWTRLISGFESFVREQGSAESDDGEVRVTEAQRAQPSWSDLDIACDEFEQGFEKVSRRANALLGAMKDTPSEVASGLEVLEGDMAEWLLDQAEARGRIHSFVSDPDHEIVYWINRGNNPTLNGAPLEVGSKLQSELFGRKKTVILTSATLAVGGGFEHVRNRLGIEEPQEVCLGSPFDYKTAALLCLPTDIPEPNAEGYAEAISQVIDRLATIASGRTMVLFTSHAGVRSAALRLRALLPQRGIEVLAQGVDGTPQQLLSRFQNTTHAVLLGTASFWEGVDVGNEALKVLVVARLPFNVPTEPIFAARADQYDQAFIQYAVPQAVLRFRQGFGRLIRSKGDRGVVVVLDSRISSKSYGKSFLSSLPPAETSRGLFEEIVPDITEWLAKS